MNRVKLLLKLADTFRRALDGIDRNGAEHDKKGLFTGKGNGGENTASESTESEIFVQELPKAYGHRRFHVNGRNYSQTKLPKKEYARVMNEIYTWMTKERIQKGLYWQPIRDHTYGIIVVDEKTNDVVVISKKEIK